MPPRGGKDGERWRRSLRAYEAEKPRVGFYRFRHFYDLWRMEGHMSISARAPIFAPLTFRDRTLGASLMRRIALNKYVITFRRTHLKAFAACACANLGTSQHSTAHSSVIFLSYRAIDIPM